MRNLFFLFLLFSGSVTFAQKLVNVTVNKNIQMKVPDTFINMNDQDRMTKVASSKIPFAMFTTQDQEVTLGVNDNPMQWTAPDTKTVYGFYKASIRSLFDKVEFIQDDIRKINGREFIVFEFVSTVVNDNEFSSKKPQSNYSYIQYTSYNGQVLLFNFGCRARYKNQWEGIAKEVMESVKIK
ncbi:MAG: hypothetical protein AAGA66_11635 [Bacteroidota bacterium]